MYINKIYFLTQLECFCVIEGLKRSQKQVGLSYKAVLRPVVTDYTFKETTNAFFLCIAADRFLQCVFVVHKEPCLQKPPSTANISIFYHEEKV